jgi:hypothetical protein
MAETAIVALVAALLGSVIGPWIQKLWVEPYALRKQKERNCYELFVENLDGLYSGSRSGEKTKILLSQYRVAWLYAKDSVVLAINELLVKAGATIKPPEPNSREHALGHAMLQMRKRNIRRTRLSESDHLIVVVGGNSIDNSAKRVNPSD